MAANVWDVAIVGFGPVGMAAAALLGQSGHRVIALERYPGKYNLSRAATFDDETMRTFAKLNVAELLLPKVRAQRSYEWRNGAGDLLIEHEFSELGPSGWAEWYMMYQPDLEDALEEQCRSLGNVEVRFGARVTGIQEHSDRVALTVEGEAMPISARYVIGCDGGNSFVRKALGIETDDYGFSEPWLVCDFRLRGKNDLPMARQVCDPEQPTSIISLGPTHHRFSFMLGLEEDAEVERAPDRVWRRVRHYLKSDQADLIRAATYTFRSLVAREWRRGRVMLAGDAAHQMPPFLGQGMCSGVRDALNLAFKFDLILSGRCDDSILTTYQSERDQHVRAIILKGIELGRVQTMRDPDAAAARDAELLAKRGASTAPDRMRFPPLGEGLFGPGDGARELMPQGFVEYDGDVGRFDAVVGYGFMLLVDEVATSLISTDISTSLTDAGIRIVRLTSNSAGKGVYDKDGDYADWMAAHNCHLAVVRPDFHTWGTARDASEVTRLLEKLHSQLGSRPFAPLKVAS